MRWLSKNFMKVLIEYPKKRKDRVKVSSTWMDLMDMDQTIARVLYPLFKKYRANYNKKRHFGGFPTSMTEGICEPYEMSEEDEAKCLQKWLSIIDKIVYSFKALSDDSIDWDGPAQKEMFKECKKIKRTYQSQRRIKAARLREVEEQEANPGLPGYRCYEFEEGIKICSPIYAKYQPIFDEHKKRVQEGLDLFAKYYGSFWY